jgi:hypothetical protein
MGAGAGEGTLETGGSVGVPQYFHQYLLLDEDWAPGACVITGAKVGAGAYVGDLVGAFDLWDLIYCRQ